MAESEILFVGDIQGCAQELEHLLQESGFVPGRHRLIPLGDTINRGPNAPGVLRLLRQAGAEPIQGNHEVALLKHVEAGDLPDWSKKGSALTQLMEAAMLEEAVSWIESWPFLREEADWVAVHAGVHPLMAPADTPPGFLTSVRFCNPEGERPPFNDNKHPEPPPGFTHWFDLYKGEKVVMFGHWALMGLIVRDNLRGLDSGCVYGGPLTGLWWPEDRLVQVPSQQPYRRLPPAYHRVELA